MFAGVCVPRIGALAAFVWLFAVPTAIAQDFLRGTIVPAVSCAEDAAQSYALYLPSDYTTDRPWNLLLAFHPGARGQVYVERYRAAAERFGYIIAASNNSRNGSWDETIKAVRAVSRDVGRRFTVSADRIYLTGHSGGARVAMEVALGPNEIAGVIASSAGFPDAEPRTSVPFPVFATAGTDDFNYLELRRLEAKLTSPHHLAVFEGGHEMPPEAVTMEALEWLEVQALRSNRRPRDRRLIEALVASRVVRVDQAADGLAKLRLLQASVKDFAGLADVSALQTRADALAGTPETKRAVVQDRADLELEARLLQEALSVEAQLQSPSTRSGSLALLEAMLANWTRVARATEASPERSRARRLLGAVGAGANSRVHDDEYRALIQRYRWRE